MAELPSRNISWAEVFWALFVGNKAIVHNRPILKNFLMTCAVILTIFTPFQLHMLAKSYTGATPPDAPVIKSTGIFIEKYRGLGVKNPYVDFVADNGNVYRSEGRVAPGELLELGEHNPPIKVYAEGFILQDGRGSYWPLMVRSLDGQVLLSKERSDGILMRGKDPWVTGKFMYPFAVLFWIITIYNAIKIKRTLSKGQ